MNDTDEAPKSALSVAEFTALLAQHMPQVERSGITVEAMEHGACRVRMASSTQSLRAGGTLSGPTMFALADLALYGAVLSRIGPVALAVTSTITITFLRKPAPKPLLAVGQLIRLGRKLAYGDVILFSEGEEEPVAHATGSYAIPGATP